MTFTNYSGQIARKLSVISLATAALVVILAMHAPSNSLGSSARAAVQGCDTVRVGLDKKLELAGIEFDRVITINSTTFCADRKGKYRRSSQSSQCSLSGVLTASTYTCTFVTKSSTTTSLRMKAWVYIYLGGKRVKKVYAGAFWSAVRVTSSGQAFECKRSTDVPILGYFSTEWFGCSDSDAIQHSD